MCREGHCGHFNKGKYYFVIPATQPKRTEGPPLPPAGLLITPQGKPWAEGPIGNTNTHREFPGYAFGVNEARRSLLPALKKLGVNNKTRGRIWVEMGQSGLPNQTPDFAKIDEEFNRPSFQRVRGVEDVFALGVYLRGARLRYGQHPMAGVIFSVIDGVEQLHRLANEGVIGWNDHARLRTELLSEGRFPRLANGTAPEIMAANQAALELVELIPPRLRHEALAAFA